MAGVKKMAVEDLVDMTAIPFTYLLANLSIRVRNLQDSLSSGMTRFLEHFKTVTAKYL